MTPDFYTVDELVIVCLARTIKENDIVFNGVASALPFTAMALAKKTHARNSVFIGGLQGAINPVFPFLPPVSVDHTFSQTVDFTIATDEIFNLANSGKVDRIFFGGGQIDKYGNANNTVIGDIASPKVKLPGGAGACSISCFAKQFTLWNTRHFVNEAARKQGNFTFVNNVDFITTVGHITPQGSRTELGLRGGGPDIVVTDLGIFDFDEQNKCMRIKSVHPYTTVDVITASTGFDLATINPCPVTPAPSREEVAIIRELDPLNIRKRLFNPKQLEVKMEFSS
jgi:glutaconate CoA-transferase subunit B